MNIPLFKDSQLVAGVAFKKTFSYAGFEMQPKKYQSPKIALLNVELELKAEKDNAEVRVNTVEVRAEMRACPPPVCVLGFQGAGHTVIAICTSSLLGIPGVLCCLFSGRSMNMNIVTFYSGHPAPLYAWFCCWKHLNRCGSLSSNRMISEKAVGCHGWLRGAALLLPLL